MTGQQPMTGLQQDRQDQAVAAQPTIDKIVRAHLTPEIHVIVDWLIRDQCFMAHASWRPTQRAEMVVKALLDAMPDVVADPKTWPVLGGEICKSFDRWLEHMARDAALWRALELRRRNRWWKRLWRWIDGYFSGRLGMKEKD